MVQNRAATQRIIVSGWGHCPDDGGLHDRRVADAAGIAVQRYTTNHSNRRDVCDVSDPRALSATELRFGARHYGMESAHATRDGNTRLAYSGNHQSPSQLFN